MKMILVLTLLTLLTLSSCGKSSNSQNASVTTLQSPPSNTSAGGGKQNILGGNGQSKAVTPMRWKMGSFPFQFYAGDNFSSEENAIIIDEELKWEESFGTTISIFQTVANSPVLGKSKIGDFNDDVFGIYKMDKWFPSNYSDALAITQFYGKRVNSGTPNEYLELIHADILINYKNFNFSTSHEFPLLRHYDLGTVILHELGHFLGLPHKDLSESIMAPSISYTTIKKYLSEGDKEDINNLYPEFSNSSKDPYFYSSRNSGKDSNDVNADGDNGEVVFGVIELLPDGKCLHHLYSSGEMSNEKME